MSAEYYVRPSVAVDPALFGELRSSEAFASHVISLVEAQMSAHLEAGSVDEWHHRVLDHRIAAEVAREQMEIEREGGERLAQLTAGLAAATFEIGEFEKRAAEVSEMLAPAQALVAQAETRLRPDASGGTAADGLGGPARLAQVHDQITKLGSAIEAALERMGVAFLGAIIDVIRIEEARAASLNLQNLRQEERVEHARSALERLESAYAQASEPDPYGEGSDPEPPEPEVAEMRMAA